jgi:hypothetical protein
MLPEVRAASRTFRDPHPALLDPQFPFPDPQYMFRIQHFHLPVSPLTFVLSHAGERVG